ncbi:MAG: HAD family hydrolase [Cellulomonadaceae bacterium]
MASAQQSSGAGPADPDELAQVAEDRAAVTPTDPHRVAAFFDVDNTIIRGASAFHLARGLYSRQFFSLRDLVRGALHQARYNLFGENIAQIANVRQMGLDIIKGHTVAEVTAVGEEVYDQVLAHRIFPGTRAILDDHLAKGHQVWLVTATPIEVGELIARRLDATGALATVAEHVEGVYTGRLVGDLMHGVSKEQGVRALADRLGLDLAASYAYGDSANDIPLLSAVGNPCAINPEPRLRRYARRVGWPVRDFRGKRKLAKRGLKTASWAGVAWVGGLVFRSVRRSLSR